ncbi:MAG: HAD family phosphatase [Anaerolineae bacterium]|jgi:putative hydrolase of the HAD superfamily|nr:HAD family phosphatase [Anaerolineae bacterium]
MAVQAVIFDMGGVLLRSESESGRRKWEQRLGLAEGELAAIVFNSPVSQKATVGLATDEDVWAHVASRLGLDDETLRQLRRDFWSGDRADAELAGFLRSLRPRYKTAILSNAWPGARKALTERWGLADAVDEMIISAEEGVAKPDPAIYHIALQRLGVRPAEAVFVDDMAANVEAARALGMYAVQFRTREQTIADVRHILGGDAP